MSDTQSDSGAERFAAAFEPMRRIRETSVARMRLQLGQRALDIGCGDGAHTLALARCVGAGGVVCGVDYDAAMIAQAQRRSRDEEVGAAVTYHHANAAALPWPDDHFNACRSDRIFQRMLDPAQAFDEMLRVAQPGGRVVVVNGDWTSLGINEDDSDVKPQRQHFLATLRGGNRVSGQCLQTLFSSRGLLEIELEVLPLFEIDAAQVTANGSVDATHCWQQSCSRQATAAGLYGSANVLLISGRKAMPMR